MTKPKRISLFILTALFVAVFARAVLSPEILRYKEPGTIDPADGLYVLLSPLRARAPERQAAALLESLKRGECGVGTFKVAERYCDREKAYPLRSWELVDRHNTSDDNVTLQYKVFRSAYPDDVWGNAWITVEPDRSGWRITNFDTYY